MLTRLLPLDKIGIVEKEGRDRFVADDMNYLKADEIRSIFLDYFKSKDHKVLPGASLVPHGDASLLLTGAGMVPFKPYFLGQQQPEYPRVATCQRCLRTIDIDNVGITDRHGTFFEMLGNFSFGDYFKKEVIFWAWEFVTEHLGFDEKDLWISVYTDDDQAYQIWHEQVGVSSKHIVRLGKEDNFWEIGVGYPCGPCSEIYLDRGEEYGCGTPNCRPGCDCDRFMEFWNLVFVQYRKLEDDKYEPLKAKSVDTGMGMERIAALLQGAKSIFEIDSIKPIIDKVAALANTQYGLEDKNDTSLRIITDHVRGLTFLISDGVLPGNEGRGYVLRRLLRRAARHGRLLGIEGLFLLKVVDEVIAQMQTGYPQLEDQREYIHKVVELEEKRFYETLDQGINLLQKLIDDVKHKGGKIIPGKDVFRLYDTYGFPVELTREIAAENGFTLDNKEFESEMDKQRDRARKAHADTDYLDSQKDLYRQLQDRIQCEFRGYDQIECPTSVIAMIKDGEFVDHIVSGDQVLLILPKTPFYAEGGGQVADNGTITGELGQFEVIDVFSPCEGIIVHKGRLVSGELSTGDKVIATVYGKDRIDTARHHSSTHLLQQALREVLGDHVHQSGSHVDPYRLRFDFTHFEAVTKKQLHLVEKKVNEAIMANFSVMVEVMDLDKAKSQGAMALFGEKYNDSVRVVAMGDSLELCGGTHVAATGEIGLFRIVSEGSVAAGIRRIEAVGGKRALEYTDQQEKILLELCNRLDAPVEQSIDQLDRFLKQQKQLTQEISHYKNRSLNIMINELMQQVQSIRGVNLVFSEVELDQADEMRSLGDSLRDKLAPSVIVFGSRKGGKVLLLAMASKDIAGKLVHVGNVIKEAAKICGGGGGGRADMAQAGGKLLEKLPAALQHAYQLVVKQLEEN